MRTIIRKVALHLLRRFGRDVTIRHHYTGQPLRLHSFRHKGYWWYGRRREQETMSLFSKIVDSGDVVIEAGGHIGYITMLLASRAKRIHVFEPDPNNLAYLQKNTEALTNVFVHAVGLSDTIGVARFYSESLTGQNSSFVKDFNIYAANAKESVAGAAVKEILVPTTTLDDFVRECNERVAFIKIDVEGFEDTVLRGAKKLIRDQQPKMIVEVNYGSAPATIRALRHLGYLVHDVVHMSPVEMDDNRTQNLLCIHEDDLAGLSRLGLWSNRPEPRQSSNRESSVRRSHPMAAAGH